MKRYILLGLCLLVLSVQPVWAFDMTIVHVNDSHSYLAATGDKMKLDGSSTYVQLGAWSRLATVVKAVRQERPNVALLHAGDAVQGGLYFMKYRGVPEMKFLDLLEFDAYALGNHEFDRGSEFLAQFLTNTRTPVLAANINAAGVPKLASRLEPYVILNYGDERVGIIGLTTRDTRFESSPGPGVTFADELAAAKMYSNILEGQGVDKIVLLTHVGFERDKELAAAVPGVDVIVGGHSHTLLGDSDALDALGLHAAGAYPAVVRGVKGDPVYVVTAWKWGRVMGRLDVTFDAAGVVTAIEGKPVLLVADDFKRKNDSGEKYDLSGAVRQEVLDVLKQNPVAAVVEENSDAAAFLAPFSEGVHGLYQMVIGKAVKSLPHIRVPGVAASGVSLPEGSLVAPLVAQSMLDKINMTGEPADLALLNAGGVREGIEQGAISVGTVYTLLPFGNTLYTMQLAGADIRAALEYGVTRGEGAFPYLAGARYAADMTRSSGNRITSIDLQDKNGQWQPLDSARTYRLVTNAYLAGGGDGYAMLPAIPNRIDTGFVLAQAFIEYVRNNKGLTPPASTGVTYIPAE